MELIRKYNHRGTLVALANGLKLTTSCFGPKGFIYMDNMGYILDSESELYKVIPKFTYTEYIEPIEPKQKHTYYRGFYRLRNSRNKCLYCTVWYVTENDMLDSIGSDYEIVKTETKEF